MVGFLLWIISCLGVALWKIGVVCAVVMGNLWTIYFFIVLLYPLYGFICFRFLVFNGLCQALWRGYFVGIIGLESYSNISNLIPGCLMWIVWLDQNRRSFDDTKKKLEEFYASIVFLIGLNAGVLQSVLLFLSLCNLT